MQVENGAVSRASVELKQYTQQGACWAYLRWSAGGKRFHGEHGVDGWEDPGSTVLGSAA